jgi:hypothetical protein
LIRTASGFVLGLKINSDLVYVTGYFQVRKTIISTGGCFNVAQQFFFKTHVQEGWLLVIEIQLRNAKALKEAATVSFQRVSNLLNRKMILLPAKTERT